MYLMPLAWNQLTAATLSSNAKAHEKGAPASNIVDSDPRRLSIGRGVFVVTAGVNDDIDFGAGSAAVAAGTYYSPQEMAVAAETAAQTVAAAWTCHWSQDSTNRYRFHFYRASGTDTLLNSTGAGAATSWCTKLGGFRAEDRAAAGTHTGDYAVQHGSTGDMWAWDLTAAKGAEAAVLVNPQASPALRASVRFGTTSAVSNAQEEFGCYDTELMAVFFSSAQHYRYARLDMLDKGSEQAGGVGAGYLYVGPVFEPSSAWEVSSWSLEPRRANVTARAITGQPHIAHVAAGTAFRLAWQSAPGIGPDEVAVWEDMLRTLGQHEYVIVAADPAGEPERQTRLCRVASSPTIGRVEGQGPGGRWSVSLDLETVRIR